MNVDENKMRVVFKNRMKQSEKLRIIHRQNMYEVDAPPEVPSGSHQSPPLLLNNGEAVFIFGSKGSLEDQSLCIKMDPTMDLGCRFKEVPPNEESNDKKMWEIRFTMEKTPPRPRDVNVTVGDPE